MWSVSLNRSGNADAYGRQTADAHGGARRKERILRGIGFAPFETFDFAVEVGQIFGILAAALDFELGYGPQFRFQGANRAISGSMFQNGNN
jgi:hypothetical protein